MKTAVKKSTLESPNLLINYIKRSAKVDGIYLQPTQTLIQGRFKWPFLFP